MSQRFQKTYISAQEFVENWDKEIFKLDYLDYFVFLLINHLGNQLETRFFSHRRPESPVSLTFDDTATLAFNIGDSFEFFLQERPEKSQERSSRHDLPGAESLVQRQQRDGGRRQALVSEEILRQKNFRIDLMDNVILDTLIQFYCDELNIEFEEEEREISELADFIHDVICDFIRNDGQAFLARPEEPAVEYFVELLDAEKDYQEPDEIDWSSEDEQWDGEGEFAGDWEMPYEDVSSALQIFSDQLREKQGTDAGLLYGIELFEEYLRSAAGIQNVFDLGEEHFQEFLSVWLIRRLADLEGRRVQPVFRALARLTHWLLQEYDIDLKHPYLRNYERLKTDVPRVVEALVQYFSDYDLLEMMLNRDNDDFEQISGCFEVQQLKTRTRRTMDLVASNIDKRFDDVVLNSRAYFNLKAGDILQATLIKKDQQWICLELQFIYPRTAKPFLD